MSQHTELKLIPNWTRLKQLVARHLDTSEEAIQAMPESGDSLDQVQLRMAIEEVVDKLGK